MKKAKSDQNQMILISIFTGILILLLELNCFTHFRFIIASNLPFLMGKREFISNFILGVFSTAVMAFISSSLELHHARKVYCKELEYYYITTIKKMIDGMFIENKDYLDLILDNGSVNKLVDISTSRKILNCKNDTIACKIIKVSNILAIHYLTLRHHQDAISAGEIAVEICNNNLNSLLDDFYAYSNPSEKSNIIYNTDISLLNDSDHSNGLSNNSLRKYIIAIEKVKRNCQESADRLEEFYSSKSDWINSMKANSEFKELVAFLNDKLLFYDTVTLGLFSSFKDL